MLTLGIDTSNYATSLAVFDTDAGEVVCDCKKFLPVKEGQLGLRQSDALFHHTAALPAMLAELGDQFCTSAETACSCGAFYLAEYVPLESWVMKKNPENYDKDNVYIDTIRYIYNQEELISGPEMVRRGEIDQARLAPTPLEYELYFHI